MPSQIVIIGGGPGGNTAATYAARLGAKVTLIERDKGFGGFVYAQAHCHFRKPIQEIAEFRGIIPSVVAADGHCDAASRHRVIETCQNLLRTLENGLDVAQKRLSRSRKHELIRQAFEQIEFKFDFEFPDPR